MTHRRGLCSTAAIAEKLYVCGGEDGSVSHTLERLDPAVDTWELLRSALHRRMHTTVAVLRDRLYLVGGMSDDNTASNSVECFDPDIDSWEESTPLLNARSGAKVARVSGCLYVIGGRARNAHGGFSFLRLAERFDPVTGRWEALPDMAVPQASVVAVIHA